MILAKKIILYKSNEVSNITLPNHSNLQRAVNCVHFYMLDVFLDIVC